MSHPNALGRPLSRCSGLSAYAARQSSAQCSGQEHWADPTPSAPSVRAAVEVCARQPSALHSRFTCWLFVRRISPGESGEIAIGPMPRRPHSGVRWKEAAPCRGVGAPCHRTFTNTGTCLGAVARDPLNCLLRASGGGAPCLPMARPSNLWHGRRRVPTAIAQLGDTLAAFLVSIYFAGPSPLTRRLCPRHRATCSIVEGSCAIGLLARHSADVGVLLSDHSHSGSSLCRWRRRGRRVQFVGWGVSPQLARCYAVVEAKVKFKASLNSTSAAPCGESRASITPGRPPAAASLNAPHVVFVVDRAVLTCQAPPPVPHPSCAVWWRVQIFPNCTRHCRNLHTPSQFAHATGHVARWSGFVTAGERGRSHSRLKLACLRTASSLQLHPPCSVRARAASEATRQAFARTRQAADQ